MYVCMYVCMCVYVCICVCMYVCVYVCVCMYGCMHVCIYINIYIQGRDSSVGIATAYGLDGQAIESRWGEIFRPVQTGPLAHPASCTMGTGSFPGVKQTGRGVDHPPHLATRLKKEQSYTSTPPLDLRGLFWGETSFTYIYIYIYIYSFYPCMTS